MELELQKKIDLLVEMSGSTVSYDELLEELNDLEKEIATKKAEVKELKKSMKDSKYMKENDRLIDENIKVGLENKKEVYEHDLEDVMTKLNKAMIDEEDIHNNLDNVNSRINSLQALLDTLQNKLKLVHKDASLTEFYENMVEKTTKDLENEEKKKRIITANYKKIEDLLERLGNEKEDLEKRITKILDKLEDTITALSTPNFYVDTYLKKKDEGLIDKLNDELEELDKQRLTIITNPVYLAHEAMNFYLEDDNTSVLSAVKDLVAIVKSKPYMNTPIEQLDELLEQVTNKRDEFANEIENNTYLNGDDKLISKRLEYLHNKLEVNKENFEEINKQIKKIDQEEVVSLTNALNEAEEIATRLSDEYNEYKKILFDDSDDKSPRKKANLQAAFRKKKEELDGALEIVLKYQNELECLIMKSKRLESEELVTLNKEKEEIEKEIALLKKHGEGKKKVKDVLAIEKDKEMLRKLNDDVIEINHAKKFSKTADEIYDEIEMSIVDKNLVEEEKQTEPVKEDVIEDDYRILEETPKEEVVEKDNEEEDASVVLEHMPTLEDIIPYFDNIEKNYEEDSEDVLEAKEFPPRNKTVNNDVKRYKVIKVEDLKVKDNTLEKDVNNEEVDVLNLDEGTDGEYINFNDFLIGGEQDAN